jgi:polar amino acid transport system substrate-binding protein
MASLFLTALAALALAMGGVAPSAAQEPASPPQLTPDGWRGGSGAQKPDMTGIERLRFITDSDFPPFNYFDEDGSLTGFNVDLARGVCEVLQVECDIRAVEWGQIFETLAKNDADAAVASIRITEDHLKQADFTQRYYETPARFAARRDSPLRDVDPEALKGRKIGVVKGTGHEAYARAFFAGSGVVAFDDAVAARTALKDRQIDLVFGDGISLMFWLNGTDAENCCEFRGGAFLESRYFGEGVGLAVRRGDLRMQAILNYALEQMHLTGRNDELFLRYFPMSFF